MKKHSHSRLVTSLLVVTLLVTAPYFSGLLIEKYYQQLASHLSNELKFKVTLQKFQRNYLNSIATLELHIAPNDNKTTPYIIPITQHIIHGPLVIDLKNKTMPISLSLAHIHHQLGEKLKAQLVEFSQNEEPLTVMTKLGFLGKGVTYVSSAAIEKATPTNSTITWGGLTGRIEHSLDMRTLSGEATAPTLGFKDHGFNLQMKEITSQFNTKEVNNNIALGGSHLQIGSLTYHEQEEQPAVKLNNININSSLDNDNTPAKQLIYALAIKLQSAEIFQQVFAESSYELQAKSINSEFFSILHANYDKKFALLGDLLKQLFASEASVELSIPANLSKTLITFGNFQFYKNSIIGKIDPRTKEQIFAEISANTNNSFEKLTAQKIFIAPENSEAYKLTVNFEKSGKVLLNGEQLQNPFAALTALDQLDNKTTEHSAPPASQSPSATTSATEPTPTNSAATPPSAHATAPDATAKPADQSAQDLIEQLSVTDE